MQLFFIGLLGFSMVGCHGCKEPVMPDPCEGVEEVTADFKMEYSMGYNEDERWFTADTVTTTFTVRFSALGHYDKVEWKVGSDPRVFTSRSFSLYFDTPATVLVRMIGYREPNVNCFPDDDGVDTIFRQLVVIPQAESLLVGDYDGYFLSAPDSSFVLSIIEEPITQEIWVYEFPKGCVKTVVSGSLGWIGYKSFFTARDGVSGYCPMPYAWGFLNNDTLNTDFHI